jgi:hypothetical protein
MKPPGGKLTITLWPDAKMTVYIEDTSNVLNDARDEMAQHRYLACTACIEVDGCKWEWRR